MKIGILSDSHDDLDALAKAVALFNAEGVVQVLHAGDIVSPFTFEAFRELRAPLGGVFGNNYGDRLLLRERSAGALHVQPHFVTLDGLRGVIVHEPPLIGPLARSGDFDFGRRQPAAGAGPPRPHAHRRRTGRDGAALRRRAAGLGP